MRKVLLRARSSGASARWWRRTDRPCFSTKCRECRRRRKHGCSTCFRPARSCRSARHAREVDVRIIAASDVRLVEAVEAGRFREDLYYKLNATHVAVPPLRDRADDIAALTRHLLERIAQQPGLRQLDITDDTLDLLRRYDWPGNVRQLQNALFRAAVLCEGDALTTADFPQIAALGIARRSRRAMPRDRQWRRQPVPPRRPSPPAGGDRGRCHPPGDRPLSWPHDGGCPAARDRPVDALSQARRIGHRQRGVRSILPGTGRWQAAKADGGACGIGSP